MKRTISIIIFVVLLLASCQPTPQKEVVVSKADGGLQEIIESSPAPTQEIEVEERWETKLQKGRVFITVDAEIVTPDVKAYPVLSVVPITMNQEWTDKALDVFFQGTTPYERAMTKQATEARILTIKRVMEQIKSGNLSNGFTEKDYSLLEEETAVLMDIHKTAPDEKDLIVSDTTFIEKFNGQFTLKSLEVMGKVNKPSFAELFIINNKTIKFNLIQFYNYGGMRSFTSIEYTDGEQLNNVTISLEEARKIAEDKIASMGISGVELTDIKVANISELRPRFSVEDVESDKQAYEFVYEKKYNGINVTYFDSRMMILQTENDPEPEPYSVVLEPEKLKVQVDDSGVIFFDWKNPTYSDGVISENAKLLDLEKIKEIFNNQVVYHYFYNDIEGSLDINIDKIVLSYFIQPVKDNNDEYIAIPVWDFVRSGEFNGMEGTYLTINAIDGSVINRDLGY